MKRATEDIGLALMVYETWLLNGATDESLPPLSLQKWCNHKAGRRLFPLRQPKKAN